MIRSIAIILGIFLFIALVIFLGAFTPMPAPTGP